MESSRGDAGAMKRSQQAGLQLGTNGGLKNIPVFDVTGIYNDDGSFRAATQLRQVFSAIDLDGDEELITYCTIGGRAATAWFVLTYLIGRERVRVYDGSWAEWGRLPGTPIEGR